MPAASCSGSSATGSVRCVRRSGSPRSYTSPTPVPRLADAEAAEALYPELAAYSGGNVMIGHLVACYGAADRYLGMIGHGARRLGVAPKRISQSALALNTGLGARTWLAHTSYEYARMLLARGAGDDRAHARAQLGVAVGLAQAIGMPDAPPPRRQARPERRAGDPAPGRPERARGRDPRRARPGALEPRDRPRASTSASTRRRTTSARSSARPAAPTARRQPAMPSAAGSSRPTARSTIDPMPLYVIERTFADRLELTDDDVRLIDAVNTDEGVSWLFSFISADKLRPIASTRRRRRTRSWRRRVARTCPPTRSSR